MDRFDAMQAFARVVETGSFTKAAETLHMSRTSVTQLVQQLEARLRVRLLNRTTRKLNLTADGAAYYERVIRLLAELDDAETSLSSAALAPRGRLRIDVPSPLARLLLIGRRQRLPGGRAGRPGHPLAAALHGARAPRPRRAAAAVRGLEPGADAAVPGVPAEPPRQRQAAGVHRVGRRTDRAACAAVASAALKQGRRRILENPGVMVSGQGSIYAPRL